MDSINKSRGAATVAGGVGRDLSRARIERFISKLEFTSCINTAQRNLVEIGKDDCYLERLGLCMLRVIFFGLLASLLNRVLVGKINQR